MNAQDISLYPVGSTVPIGVHNVIIGGPGGGFGEEGGSLLKLSSSKYQQGTMTLQNGVILIQADDRLELQGVEITASELMELKEMLQYRETQKKQYIIKALRNNKDLGRIVHEYYCR